MDIKNKIEEILLTDYQYVDYYTVDKLLDLFAVSGQLPNSPKKGDYCAVCGSTDFFNDEEE